MWVRGGAFTSTNKNKSDPALLRLTGQVCVFKRQISKEMFVQTFLHNEL